MQGFDYERARKELHIPDEFQVEAMAAVGKPGRRNYSLKNCGRAKVRTIAANFRRAFSRDHLSLTK
jgi:hypothetical protein